MPQERPALHAYGSVGSANVVPAKTISELIAHENELGWQVSGDGWVVFSDPYAVVVSQRQTAVVL